MTAYEVIPVGAHGPDRERSQVVEVLTYEDLLLQNERLSADLERARVDADAWHQAWATVTNNRLTDRQRLSRAMRALAVLGAESQEMAARVEQARVEIWGKLP